MKQLPRERNLRRRGVDTPARLRMSANLAFSWFLFNQDSPLNLAMSNVKSWHRRTMPAVLERPMLLPISSECRPPYPEAEMTTTKWVYSTQWPLILVHPSSKGTFQPYPTALSLQWILVAPLVVEIASQILIRISRELWHCRAKRPIFNESLRKANTMTLWTRGSFLRRLLRVPLTVTWLQRLRPRWLLLQLRAWSARLRLIATWSLQ